MDKSESKTKHDSTEHGNPRQDNSNQTERRTGNDETNSPKTSTIKQNINYTDKATKVKNNATTTPEKNSPESHTIKQHIKKPDKQQETYPNINHDYPTNKTPRQSSKQQKGSNTNTTKHNPKQRRLNRT